MKKLILAAALLSILAVPALCDDEEHEGHEMSLDQQMAQIEFHVKSEMAELEVAKARLEVERMEREMNAQFECDDDDDAEEIYESLMDHGHVLGGILAVINILAAVWVFGDMKGRPSASWIWIVLVLLAGMCALIAYGVIRIGDNHEAPKKK